MTHDMLSHKQLSYAGMLSRDAEAAVLREWRAKCPELRELWVGAGTRSLQSSTGGPSGHIAHYSSPSAPSGYIHILLGAQSKLKLS